ncbi:hypothetical protein L7F22_022028 [Adiantum nelumboides]|nr:hypothetical protein [Adiantum nelumboides]
METWRTPGELLGRASEYTSGRGTYVWNNKIYSSVVGVERVSQPPPFPQDKSPVIEVIGEKQHGAVPEPGLVITGKVGKVMAKSALVDIVCVGSRAVKEKFSGILRQQDVRVTEIDKVEMYNCFRPGDIIKAEVLSLGDARSYVLTTAKNELGVVSATSVAGAKMVPVSWQEMMCPLTNQKEPRKVAKVV